MAGNFGHKDKEEHLTQLIRSSWRFASICHFCHIFRCLGLRFVPRELEFALLHPYDSRFLEEIHWKLVVDENHRMKYHRDFSDWETRVRNTLNMHTLNYPWPPLSDSNTIIPDHHPLAFYKSYTETTIEQRLAILDALCIIRVESENGLVRDEINNNIDKISSIYRGHSIGEDLDGTMYYHLTEGPSLFSRKFISQSHSNNTQLNDLSKNQNMNETEAHSNAIHSSNDINKIINKIDDKHNEITSNNDRLSNNITDTNIINVKHNEITTSNDHFSNDITSTDITNVTNDKKVDTESKTQTNTDINKSTNITSDEMGRIISYFENTSQKGFDNDDLPPPPTTISLDNIDEIACQICSKTNDPDTTLLCDLCNNAFHMSCLFPPLKNIPLDDWYCEKCFKYIKLKTDNQIEEYKYIDEYGPCCVCNGLDDPEFSLICDSCDGVFHMYCLSPPLDKIPEASWYCTTCTHYSLNLPSGHLRLLSRTGGDEYSYQFYLESNNMEELKLLSDRIKNNSIKAKSKNKKFQSLSDFIEIQLLAEEQREKVRERAIARRLYIDSLPRKKQSNRQETLLELRAKKIQEDKEVEVERVRKKEEKIKERKERELYENSVWEKAIRESRKLRNQNQKEHKNSFIAIKLKPFPNNYTDTRIQHLSNSFSQGTCYKYRKIIVKHNGIIIRQSKYNNRNIIVKHNGITITRTNTIEGS